MPRKTTTTPLAAKVGARIQALRCARNMTLADAADAAGLSRVTFRSVEKGFSDVPVQYIGRIAKALELPPLYIMAFPDDDERARAADLIRELPASDLAKWRRELRARGGVEKGARRG